MTRHIRIRSVLENGTKVLAQWPPDRNTMRPGIVTTHTISQEAWLAVGHSAQPDGLIVRFTDEEGGSAEYSYSSLDPDNWDNSLVRPRVLEEEEGENT